MASQKIKIFKKYFLFFNFCLQYVHTDEILKKNFYPIDEKNFEIF